MLVFVAQVSCVYPLEAIVIMSSASRDRVRTNVNKQNKTLHILSSDNRPLLGRPFPPGGGGGSQVTSSAWRGFLATCCLQSFPDNNFHILHFISRLVGQPDMADTHGCIWKFTFRRVCSMRKPAKWYHQPQHCHGDTWPHQAYGGVSLVRAKSAPGSWREEEGSPGWKVCRWVGWGLSSYVFLGWFITFRCLCMFLGLQEYRKVMSWRWWSPVKRCVLECFQSLPSYALSE